MNDILIWLVMILGWVAAIGCGIFLAVLTQRAYDATTLGSLHAWLDKVGIDRQTDYMEAEAERCTAVFHGDPDAESPWRWYGLHADHEWSVRFRAVPYLVKRRLHLWQYDIASVLYKRRLGLSEEDVQVIVKAMKGQ